MCTQKLMCTLNLWQSYNNKVCARDVRRGYKFLLIFIFILNLILKWWMCIHELRYNVKYTNVVCWLVVLVLVVQKVTCRLLKWPILMVHFNFTEFNLATCCRIFNDTLFKSNFETNIKFLDGFRYYLLLNILNMYFYFKTVFHILHLPKVYVQCWLITKYSR